MAHPEAEQLAGIYGDAAAVAEARYAALEQGFARHFGALRDPWYFSAPGRTEIIGNHTDHNGGMILAASITMDTICAAAPSATSLVRIVSEGYDAPFEVDLEHLDRTAHGPGTAALLAGIFDAARQRGLAVGGFDAYVSTEVIPSAGVSSSASFEMLVGTVVSHLFNGGNVPVDVLARMGQHAENAWWGKASGLMDQMACGVGGTILLDFSDGARYEPVSFSFDELGYDLVIVNTGKGHADLSAEYSAIPNEMHDVARALGVDQLCQTSEEELLARLPELRQTIGCDRALVRALHFFEECRRVEQAREALAAGRPEQVIDLVRESGSSSWRWLQNVVVPGSAKEQPIPLALALTELYLRRVGAGACRVHGGGFAGVIMCVLPKAESAGYASYIERLVGAGNAHVMGVRQTGAVRVA